MFTIRLFIEVLVRKVVVAEAILTVEPYEQKHALRTLEDLVRTELHVPTSFLMTTRVIKERPVHVGESVMNAVHYTGNEVNLSTNMHNDKAWMRVNAKVAHQQAVSREHKMYHGDNQSARGQNGKSHSSRS